MTKVNKHFFKKNWSLIALLAIVLFCVFLRFYKLGVEPNGFSWDEAAVGYNAWSIFHTGADEWGNKLPLVFRSFEDYKHPVHIYLTVPFVAVFGLTEFATRASSALFGVLSVVAIYFLAIEMFRNKPVALFASLSLAFSPYNIHFSRFNHELNFAVLFLILGLYLVLLGLRRKDYLVSVGFGVLGFDLLTYHSAKIVVPVVTLFLIAIYIKEFLKVKKYFVCGLVAFLFFVLLIVLEPNLLGIARVEQTSDLNSWSLTNIFEKYKTHFSLEYLFEIGDSNPRLSAQNGNFYVFESIFMIFGLIMSLYKLLVKKEKAFLILLVWILISPLPASISTEYPHAGRAMYMTGSMHLLIAVGIGWLFSTLRNFNLKFVAALFLIVLYSYMVYGFVSSYSEYSERYAIEWQYGMREVVEFVKAHPEYYKVYMTNIRQQPYIFYLFYENKDPSKFLKSAKYDSSSERSFNTVRAYDRYQFGGWDTVESIPNPEILYIVQPADYVGLRLREIFDIQYLVKYPNGVEAFYIVSGKTN